MGVTLFRDTAPQSFGLFDRALSSMFRLTAGETWVDELVLLDPDEGGWRVGWEGRRVGKKGEVGRWGDEKAPGIEGERKGMDFESETASGYLKNCS
jgi:hypothetical protein